MSSNGINTIWTEPVLETLRRGWELCLSGSAIAALIYNEHGIGVSRNAVIGKMTRLRLECRRSKPRKTNPKKIAARQDRSRPHIEARPCVPMPKNNDAVTATAVHILDLEPHHCRWVMGEPTNGMFCGCDTVAGISYCAAHAQRAYLPPRLAIRSESRELVEA